MMHVPVDNENFVHSLDFRLSGTSGDSNVVEEAETRRAGATAVVARRAHDTHCVLQLSPGDFQSGFGDAAGREACSARRSLRNVNIVRILQMRKMI